jgi:hypothetical protein
MHPAAKSGLRRRSIGLQSCTRATPATSGFTPINRTLATAWLPTLNMREATWLTFGVPSLPEITPDTHTDASD